MDRTNSERVELKEQGYIYYRKLGKWMTIDEIESYERTEDVTEKVTWWVGLAIAAGIFIFMFTYKP
ncbi:hypothetical protein N9M46_05645 [Gammaproteobacteria bacterium]|nr:hypothetical protein [Gammaproteobacteria bacterium]